MSSVQNTRGAAADLHTDPNRIQDRQWTLQEAWGRYGPWVVTVINLTLFLCAWEAVTRAALVNPLFLPAPVIGVGSFLLFLLMLAAIMGLRSVGKRHEVPGVDDYHQGRGYDEREHSHWGTN